MTPAEVRRTATDLLARRPLNPVVFEVADGRRFVADKPDQVRFEPRGVSVHRSGYPEPVLIHYDAVRRVAGIDDLPAEPGAMSYRDFYATVRPLYWAEPFRPFVIELRDGRTVLVETSTKLTMAGRFGTYWAPGGMVKFLTTQVAKVAAVAAAEVGGS